MCRLFGRISLNEESAADFLVSEKFSLLKQSNCNRKCLQKDGWGIAAWEVKSKKWKVAKSAEPVFKEKRMFKKLAAKAKSRIIIAHIRHASNPKKLPLENLIARENSQPFSFQNLSFVHNGTLNISDEIAETLGTYRKSILGANDSEVLFWLFVKIWQQYSYMKTPEKLWRKVFQKSVRHIHQVWNNIPKNKRRFSAPFRGLNCIASDGKTLAALCYYHQAEGRSLCGQNRPYFEMGFQTMTERVAVASEPMDDSENWEPIPNKHLLIVKEGKLNSLIRLTEGGLNYG